MSKELQEFEETAAKLLKPPPGAEPPPTIEEIGNPERDDPPRRAVSGLRPRRRRMHIVFKILAGLVIVALSFFGTLYLMDIYYPVQLN
jgi:hypothetical protein